MKIIEQDIFYPLHIDDGDDNVIYIWQDDDSHYIQDSTLPDFIAALIEIAKDQGIELKLNQ